MQFGRPSVSFAGQLSNDGLSWLMRLRLLVFPEHRLTFRFSIDRMRQRLQSRRLKLRFFSLLLTLLALAPVSPPAAAAERRPSAFQSETDETFRLHLPYEPESLDPARTKSVEANYFFNTIMRGLYQYKDKQGLVPDGAKKCTFQTSTKLVCELSEKKWSDGSAVTAQDYLRTFRNLVAPDNPSPMVELLKNVSNALAIKSRQKPLEQLGVFAPTKDRLEIEFNAPEPDFLYKLTASALTPSKYDTFPPPGSLGTESKPMVFNGPYRILKWQRGKSLTLEPNPYFQGGHPQRPKVEFLFLDDEQTALHLYEAKKLNFLRRLGAVHIAKFKARPDFHLAPLARFDYLGFGSELRDQPELRAALSYSADFSELQKILDALGIPGCPSLPEKFMDYPRCVRFDLKKAQAHLAKVPEEMRKRRLTLMFSKLGGDEVKRVMEWFQGQWQKNLGVRVELQQTEQQVYLATLREKPPALFRKGVGLDRLTCLAALETFKKDGAENFLKIADPIYEKAVSRVASTVVNNAKGEPQPPSPAAKKACGEAVQRLLDQHLLIPLGRIHFALLADTRYAGWTLNEMNQLDLSQIHAMPPSLKK